MSSQVRNAVYFILSVFPALLYAQDDYGYKEGYNLVWHDEFIDSNVTNNLWSRQFPWGPFAAEVTYGPRYGTIHFEDGQINLLNKKEKVNGVVYAWDSAGNFTPYYRDFDYTMGMLYSKRDFLHGYFETSFRSDPGKGFYNAFWLYGEKGCELDVFELQGSEPHDAQMTLHWKDKDPITGSAQSITHLKSDKHFGEIQHTFASEWTSSDVKWFHNGEEVPQTSYTRWVRRRHIPDVPMNVILNSCIATTDGLPDSTTQLPGKIRFDYVRVYQSDSIVRAPVITGQEAAKYLTYDPTPMSLKMLHVDDHYKVYPYGFKYQILPGDNYSTDGLNYSVTQGYRGIVQLNVRIHDGLNWSATRKVNLDPDSHLDIAPVERTDSGYLIYPNPGSGIFHLDQKLAAPADVRVLSLDGKLLYTSRVSAQQNQIDLSFLGKGLYLITLSNGNSPLWTSRLIID